LEFNVGRESLLVNQIFIDVGDESFVCFMNLPIDCLIFKVFLGDTFLVHLETKVLAHILKGCGVK